MSNAVLYIYQPMGSSGQKFAKTLINWKDCLCIVQFLKVSQLIMLRLPLGKRSCPSFEHSFVK